MNIIGLGNDIIEIERIRTSLSRHNGLFINKILTPNETVYSKKFKDPSPHIAGRFAAKEAIAKALGTGFGKELQWHDIEIMNNEKGKPICTLSPVKFKNHKIEISISHCHEYATATAIILL